jgi:hypothetical protein
MAGKTRVWQTGDSWNKLAYAYYGDSREFRRLIELNSGFDIRTNPASTIPVFITGPDGILGKTGSSDAAGAPGTLNQLSTALNLSGDSNPNPEQQDIATAIFPWSNLSEYAGRLSEYTAYAILERDRMNGYGLDSPQARADTQRG